MLGQSDPPGKTPGDKYSRAAVGPEHHLEPARGSTVIDTARSTATGTRSRCSTPATRRAARTTFFAVMAGAFVFFVWADRHAWFAFDEWDFLSARSATSLSSLLHPHNEHWSTLPILLWRGLFQVFGIGSYYPYLLPLLLSHLGLAFLVRVVMRRNGVRPWTATIAASLFLLLGAGADDILWAFQIGFVASLVFGFGQLLLADHEGPIGRRDLLALASGLAALLCSGVGVTMVVVVGLATWARRGWRAALVQTVPLGLVYLAWFVGYGRSSYHERIRFGEVPHAVMTILTSSLRDLGQLPFFGLLLAVLLVAGLVLAWRHDPWVRLRIRAAQPGALLVGALLFMVVTSLGRAADLERSVTPSRYVYVVAALVLPALAVAVDSIAASIGTWGVVVPLVFLLAIPGNVRLAADRDRVTAPIYTNLRRLILATPHLPIGRRLPASEIPAELFTGPTTVGWLRANAAAGRVPSPGPLTPGQQADVTQQLLLQRASPFTLPTSCEQITRPAVVTPPADALVLATGPNRATIAYLPTTGARPTPFTIGSGTPSTGVRTVLRDLRVDVRPDRGATVLVCT